MNFTIDILFKTILKSLDCCNMNLKFSGRRSRSRNSSNSRERERSRSRSRSKSYSTTSSKRSTTTVASSSRSSYCSSSSKSVSSRYSSISKSTSRSATPSTISRSEREEILSKWRRDYCNTSQQLSQKLEELASVDLGDALEQEKKVWTRSTPAELFYARDEEDLKLVKATTKLRELCIHFEEQLLTRTQKANAVKPKYEPPPRKNRARLCKHKSKIYFPTFMLLVEA